MRTLKMIIIHCTATRCNQEFTEQQLLRAHLRMGMTEIGYHYYIRRNGSIVNTRAVDKIGAHCLGYNQYSIGIAYEGGLDESGFPADTRTPRQCASLHRLVDVLRERYPTIERVTGHRDLSPDVDGDGIVEPNEWVKLCPCFDVADEF